MSTASWARGGRSGCSCGSSGRGNSGASDGIAALLREGTRTGVSKTVHFCENLLALEPALWSFTRCGGVEPTNNHPERLLRKGVLWRKGSFGTRSTTGSRFVEQILTVVQTRRLQKRPVLSFLVDAVTAHRAGRPAPSLQTV